MCYHGASSLCALACELGCSGEHMLSCPLTFAGRSGVRRQTAMRAVVNLKLYIVVLSPAAVRWQKLCGACLLTHSAHCASGASVRASTPPSHLRRAPGTGTCDGQLVTIRDVMTSKFTSILRVRNVKLRCLRGKHALVCWVTSSTNVRDLHPMQNVDTTGLSYRLVDAKGQLVGRLAAQLAVILQVSH